MLSRLLSGDDSCEWRAWFQAHHYSDSWTRADTSFDNVRWQKEHSRLPRESREGLEDDDYTVRVEKEDRFRLDGARATVGGQPDLVVKKDIDVTLASSISLAVGNVMSMLCSKTSVFPWAQQSQV